jgi:hypothetical protein
VQNPHSVSGSGLECYVCTDQEHNKEKCLNTIKTCEQGEDVCLSEIKWGSKLLCHNNFCCLVNVKVSLWFV